MRLKSIIFMLSFVSFFQSLFGQQSLQEIRGIKKAERICKRLIKRKKLPGLSITVLKDGAVFYEKGFGFANVEENIPVDPKSTIFRIASVSKPLSATALLKMVEAEEINLDASVYEYVPYYPRKKFDFTLRQLGNHTAGFRGYRGKEYMLNKPYSIKEGISIFKDDELLFEPGTSFQYNSYDWVLLSLAIQEAAKKPFETIVKEKVTNPLGMGNTFPDTGDTIPNLSTYYSKSKLKGFRPATPVNNFYKLAGGGFLSTTNDVAKLGQAYLDNAIANTKLVSEFISSAKVNGNDTYYGIGWEVSFDEQHRPYFGHIGNGVGGYAIFYIYPAQRMVVSVATNITNPKVDKELKKVINNLIEAANSVKK